MPRTRARRLGALGAAALVALALTACTGGAAPDTTATTSAKYASAARCAENRAAGRITYLTAYGFGATTTILDVLAAEKLGYFAGLCLDMTLQGGTTNAQLLSTGSAAQLGGLGSASDVMTARASDAKDIVSVATFGNTDAVELITMAGGPIRTLKDLEGRTLGYKGAVPPQVTAMLQEQGVDTAKVHFVSVGFDPTVLPRGQVQALTAYKSNEPKALAAMGDRVKEWDPAAYGVRSTFNLQVANTTFAAAHPTAVEDFLRADLEAYAWINASSAHLDQALAWSKAASPTGFDEALSRERWQTEVGLISASQPAGTVLGQQSIAQWQPEADLLVKYGLVKTAPQVSADFSDRFLDAVYSGGKLVWPAP